MKQSTNPRFDVDFKQRLTQSRTACNAVRLPRLGYELYRIYAIEDDYKRADVKMTLSKGRQHSKTYTGIQKIYTLWVDEYFKHDVAYEVKWLKPKKTTLLRMRGHRVEPAEPGDKVGHVGPIKTPVRLGR